MRPNARTRLLDVIRTHPEGLSKAEALRQADLAQWGRGRVYLNQMEAAGLIVVEREHESATLVKAAKGKPR